jgi:hypothetical protein
MKFIAVKCLAMWTTAAAATGAEGVMQGLQGGHNAI